MHDASHLAVIGACVWIDTYATEGVRKYLSKYVLSEFTEENMLVAVETKKVFSTTGTNTSMTTVMDSVPNAVPTMPLVMHRLRFERETDG